VEDLRLTTTRECGPRPGLVADDQPFGEHGVARASDALFRWRPRTHCGNRVVVLGREADDLEQRLPRWRRTLPPPWLFERRAYDLADPSFAVPRLYGFLEDHLQRSAAQRGRSCSATFRRDVLPCETGSSGV